MKKRTRRVTTIMIIFWILLLVVGGLFCCILFALSDGAQLTEYFKSPFVNTETMFLLLGLCILLTISMILLGISVVSTTIQLKRIKKAWRKYEKKTVKKKLRSAPRFNMLNMIDREYEHTHIKKVSYDSEITLEELCVRFRDYAASRLHLYYSIEDIRRFIAGFGVSKLMILQGMSGTGKTSLAYAMGRFLQNDSVVVPVQPMWKERSDMIGYFNEFTKRFNETTLLRKMYEAGYREDLYITILDEVNISRIEYYFAEFLSLLELPDENKRYLEIVSDVWPNDPQKLDHGRVLLPKNMWFIGTANNDDSTFAISDKVYDRAMVMSLEHKCEPFEAEDSEPIRLSYTHWNELITAAKNEYSISAESKRKIRELDNYMIDVFHISFGNRIKKQLYEYVSVMMACGGSEAQAIDDILVRKVFRKLESQNPSFIRANIEDLRNCLVRLFGEANVPQCLEYFDMLKNM